MANIAIPEEVTRPRPVDHQVFPGALAPKGIPFVPSGWRRLENSSVKKKVLGGFRWDFHEDSRLGSEVRRAGMRDSEQVD